MALIARPEWRPNRGTCLQDAVDARRTSVGWREWISLPALGIPALKAKVDTGARTSALHACQLDTYQRAGVTRVRFAIRPLRKRPSLLISCDAAVTDRRIVRDSGGHPEERFVIVTPLRIGSAEWPIEVTLTNRDSMLFRMLLGRTAMHERLLVVPDASYLTGKSLARTYDAA